MGLNNMGIYYFNSKICLFPSSSPKYTITFLLEDSPFIAQKGSCLSGQGLSTGTTYRGLN